MSLENVPVIPCLFDRKVSCPEDICPLYKINEKHIVDTFWKLKKREFWIFRQIFEMNGIETTPETLCDIIMEHPFTKSLVEGQFEMIEPNLKKFGDSLARIRKNWTDKYDDHWDAYKVKCLTKRDRLYSKK